MLYQILLLDDSSDFHALIDAFNNSKKDSLYKIHHLTSSKQLDSFLKTQPVDLILLDWDLGEEKTGLDLVKEIKEQSTMNNVPVFLLTANSDLESQVKGLNEGADDYILKNVPLELLFCKLNATLRNKDKTKNDQISLMHKFNFHEDTLELEYKGAKFKLTHKEFVILKTLVDNCNKVFSQDELNEITSGKDVFVTKRCIDTFITLLRKKIGKDSILSIRKKGYKINNKILA